MTTYNNLQDVDSAYVSAIEDEDNGKLEQGRVISEAVDDGFTRPEVIRRCAQLGGQSDRTTRDRERVWKIFGATGKYSAHIRHSLHVLCVTDTDIEKPDTWKAAYDWLEVAECGYRDKDGNIRPHTYASLKAQIVASGKNPDAGETVYLLDNERATVTGTRISANGKKFIEFQVDELPAVNTDETVYLTLTQVPAKEAA